VSASGRVWLVVGVLGGASGGTGLIALSDGGKDSILFEVVEQVDLVGEPMGMKDC
jgi:hypothetical protein